jgi:hypothetical protein
MRMNGAPLPPPWGREGGVLSRRGACELIKSGLSQFPSSTDRRQRWFLYGSCVFVSYFNVSSIDDNVFAWGGRVGSELQDVVVVVVAIES